MRPHQPTVPLLDLFYQRFLRSEDTAAFIKSSSKHYTQATLTRLAQSGSRVSRRAAVLALGYLAGMSANPVLGRALHDSDRAVRLLAEDGIRQLWFRDGSEAQRQTLQSITRMIDAGQLDEAVMRSNQLIEELPGCAEAWNQRAVALYCLGQFEDSANDCLQTLELNPFHFNAAVGMGHCYLDMDDAVGALQSFRRALEINPALEGVRAQIEYLERSLKGR